MDRDRLTSAHRVHAFVGLPFHADLRRVAAERARNVAANRLVMRRKLRLLGNDDDIDVDDRVARLAHNGRRTTQQLDAVRVLPRRIGVREVTADIASTGSAQHRIRDRVTDHVAVGMRLQPFFEWNAHPAKDERPPRHEPVQVISVANAQRRRLRRTRGEMLRHGQIVRRRDLEISWVAIHDANGVTCPLSKHGFISGLANEAQRVAQHRDPKRLGRLCEIDALAR
jgi:hypothetical protein